ncbi:hypothetical protein [Litoribacillus peritrichatus]|uniref:Uncharacterized protein n=1 Tax=Litoribacillus peritrichatus TaxID=718191 RepID=A0ABP7MFE4_9GAMM
MKLILSLFILVGAFVASWKYYFWEPSDFSKDSLAYHLKISPQIKAFPLWEPSSEPLFKYFTGDGVKQTTVAMMYNSNLSKRDLVHRIEDLGLTCRISSQVVFCTRNHNISIILTSSLGSTDVIVDVTFIGMEVNS